MYFTIKSDGEIFLGFSFFFFFSFFRRRVGSLSTAIGRPCLVTAVIRSFGFSLLRLRKFRGWRMERRGFRWFDEKFGSFDGEFSKRLDEVVELLLLEEEDLSVVSFFL